MKFNVRRVFKIKSMRLEWMWSLIAKNGKIVATSGSESYKNKQDCLDTIRSIKANAIKAPVIVEGQQI
jgi:uncharacterized protein YegP (UPF0339 family)